MPVIPKRKRSPEHPFLSLEDAVKTAQKVYDNEKRHAVPVEVIAQHCGYKDMKSSSAARTVAALNHYGLVTEAGAREDRKMKLSNLALDILLADPESPNKKLRAIREAALLPSIHKKIVDQFPEGLPSEQTFKSFLIRDLDFNDTQVDSFASKFRKTVDFAGIYDKNTSADDENGGTPEDDDDGDETPDNKGKSQREKGKRRMVHEGSKEYVLSLNEGSAVLTIPEALSRKSAKHIDNWLKFIVSTMDEADDDKIDDEE